MYENDIAFTGVTFTDISDVPYQAGTADYALDLTGNYLIDSATAQTAIIGNCYCLKSVVVADYEIEYFPDVYVVTGHTPTQMIAGNPRPGYIYRKNNHIAIDCGCYRPDGRLAAICLDTGEEYYVSR